MVLRIVPSQVARLEAEIDAMNASLTSLTSFILPGGTPPAAALHLARAIARRAERAAVTAAAAMPINHHARRSEEHTSELQSLMRIPYADFRFKNTKKQTCQQ